MFGKRDITWNRFRLSFAMETEQEYTICQIMTNLRCPASSATIRIYSITPQDWRGLLK